jgi:hypothetical protein
MNFQTTRLAACGCLSLILALSACGKKGVEEVDDDGPQSAQGALLESVQKTVDEANQRSRQLEESSDAATK